MPELVVDGPLFSVAQDLVRLLGFLEFVFRFRVVGIAVRVILHGEAAVRLLDFRFRGGSGHFKEFVIIVLRHCLPAKTYGPQKRTAGTTPGGSRLKSPARPPNPQAFLRSLSLTSSNSASSTSSLAFSVCPVCPDGPPVSLAAAPRD